MNNLSQALFFRVRHAVALCCLWLYCAPLLALQNAPNAPEETAQEASKRARLNALKQLPIRQLATVQFYNPEAQLAARKSRALVENPSALFVLSGEEIARAGISSLPEALRMIPGVQVSRLYSNRWAISARGLNGYISSKLLVMIDGRTLYTPLRSEVFWDVQDLPLEDVDRIEVIRGPGASLWGANAVNGIINIVSKPAAQTQGGLLRVLLGQGEANADVGVRYGGTLGDKGHYRVYGKTVDYAALRTLAGADAQDDWNTRRLGFRLDYAPQSQDALSVQGNLYQNDQQHIRQLLDADAHFVPVLNAQKMQGGHVLGHWQRSVGRGEWRLQGYYDWTERQDRLFDESRHTLDVDFQHRLPLSSRQEYLWGAGVRYSQDDIETFTRMLGYTQPQRDTWLLSAFVQGEFVLQPDRWRLLIGSKVEHNSFSGFEYQPSVRLLWSPHSQHRLWAALSRAVRTPSRTDHDGFVETLVFNPDLKSPVILRVLGNAAYESETLLAYELGYRYLPSSRLLLDVSLFAHDLHKLRTGEPVALDLKQRPPLLLTLIDNQLQGEVLGAELSLHWQAQAQWRLYAGYSYTQVFLHLLPGSRSVFGETEEGNNPQHQINLHSQWELNPRLQTDLSLYYVSAIPGQSTPEYWRADWHLGWQARPRLRLDLGVRNLLQRQHPEFGNVISGNTEIPGEIPRSLYAQLSYLF